MRGLSARSTRELCLSSLDFGRAARACGSHTGGHSTQARLQRRRSGARVLGLERRYLRLRVPWDSGGANQRPSARSARALCLSLRPRTSNATTKPIAEYSRAEEGSGSAAAAAATAVAARLRRGGGRRARAGEPAVQTATAEEGARARRHSGEGDAVVAASARVVKDSLARRRWGRQRWRRQRRR